MFCCSLNLNFMGKVMNFFLPSLEKNLVNERKLIAPINQKDFAVDLLSCHCFPDDSFPVGKIRSIYFDSYDLSSYDEKRNGDNIKVKLRLRWYGEATNPDGTTRAFLEAKHRLGSARRKFRQEYLLPVDWLEKTPLEDASFSEFIQKEVQKLDLLESFYWTPTVIIAYDRMRFFCPNTQSRIALDYNICSPKINRLRFSYSPETIALDTVVCEFKNAGGIPPPWLETLTIGGFKIKSFSKYGSIMDSILQRTLP